MATVSASILKDGAPKAAGAGDVVQAESFSATVGFQLNGTALAATDIDQDSTGTTATAFQLASGASGPKLKNNAGDVQARNAADDAYTSIDALAVKISGTTALDANGAAKVAAAVAGSGLAHSAGVLSVGVDDSTIEVSSDALRVKDAGVTAAKLADAVADLIRQHTVSASAEGAFAGDTIRVTCQVKDAAGNAVNGRYLVEWRITDADYAAALTAQAPTTSLNAGAATEPLTADKHGRAWTDATGKLELDVTLAGNFSVYVQMAVGGAGQSVLLDFN